MAMSWTAAQEAAMTYLVFRCEDGAVEIDNFVFNVDNSNSVSTTTKLNIPTNQQAIYECDLEFNGTGNVDINFGGTSMAYVSADQMKVAGKIIGKTVAKVKAEEIENELISAPGVLEIGVYEGQSRRGLEYNAIVAEIYPDKDYFEKNKIEDIKEYFKACVKDYNASAVPYKKIGLVKVRSEEFPKNTLRKILRFKLDMTIE